MTFNEAKKQALEPQAFSVGETWMVKNSATNRPTEGAGSEAAALKAAAVLNDHETRNGRPAVYVAEALE